MVLGSKLVSVTCKANDLNHVLPLLLFKVKFLGGHTQLCSGGGGG